jgi:hypothetical protein
MRAKAELLITHDCERDHYFELMDLKTFHFFEIKG